MAIEFGNKKPNFAGGAAMKAGIKVSVQDNPLAKVEYTGDVQEDAAAELTELQRAYRERAKAESNRFADATDSEFWFAVCFRDRAEKDAFLAEFGVERLGDKYVDGALLAKALRKLVGEGR